MIEQVLIEKRISDEPMVEAVLTFTPPLALVEETPKYPWRTLDSPAVRLHYLLSLVLLKRQSRCGHQRLERIQQNRVTDKPRYNPLTCDLNSRPRGRRVGTPVYHG